MQVAYLLYDLLLVVAFILYFPFALYKMIVKGKYREGVAQRFGFLPTEIKDKFADGEVIWVHAVSVGETVAASSLVTEIRNKYPNHKILFSTVTDTGQEMAHKIINEADGFIYFPFDFFFFLKKVLKDINPKLVVIMETELCPNFIREASNQGSKVMIANGRIDDDSAQNYKYLGPIMKDMLNNIDILSMPTGQGMIIKN